MIFLVKCKYLYDPNISRLPATHKLHQCLYLFFFQVKLYFALERVTQTRFFSTRVQFGHSFSFITNSANFFFFPGCLLESFNKIYLQSRKLHVIGLHRNMKSGQFEKNFLIGFAITLTLINRNLNNEIALNVLP